MPLTAVRVHQPGDQPPWRDIAAYINAPEIVNYREPLPVVAVLDSQRDWYRPTRLTDTRKVYDYIEEHDLRVVKVEMQGGCGRSGYDWNVYLAGIQ